MSLFDSDDKTFDSSGAEVSAERPASSLPAGGREGEGESFPYYTADLSRLKAPTGSGSKSTVVKDFCKQLNSVLESKPPISRAKVQAITKSALAAGPYYKHIVCNIERFIQKCKSEYKLPGLYLIDSVVRQSRHQFGPARDVFGPRFLRNIEATFRNLIQCSNDDKKKVIRVLNLWQRGAVFPADKITVLMQIISEADPAQPKGNEQQTDRAHLTETRRADDVTAAAQASANRKDTKETAGKVEKVQELQDALSCLQRVKESGFDIKSLLINKEGNLRSIDNSLIMEIHQLTSQLLDDQKSKADGPNCPAKRRMDSPVDTYVHSKEIKPDFGSQSSGLLMGSRDCVDNAGSFGNDSSRSDAPAIGSQNTGDYAMNLVMNAGRLSEKESILKTALPDYTLERNTDPVAQFSNVFPSAQLPMVNMPQYSQFFPQPRVVAAAPSRPATSPFEPTVGNSTIDANAARGGHTDYSYRPDSSFPGGNVVCADKFSNAGGPSYGGRSLAAASNSEQRPGLTGVDALPRSTLQYPTANQTSVPSNVANLPAVHTRFDIPQVPTSEATARHLAPQPGVPWDPSPFVGWRPGLPGEKRALSRPLLPTPKIGCTSVDVAANLPNPAVGNLLTPGADTVGDAVFRLSQPQQGECHLPKQPLTAGFGPAAPTPIRQQTQQPDKDERRPLSPSQCQFSRQPSWPPVHEASSLSSFKTWPDCQTSPAGFGPTPTGDESESHFWEPPNKQTEQQFVDAGREPDIQEQTTRRDMKPSWSDENGEVEQPRRLSLSQRIEAAVRSPPYGDHRPARQPAKDRSSSRKDARLRSDGGNNEMKRRHFHPTDRDPASYGSVERMAQDRDERHDTSSYNDDSSVLTDKYQRGKTDSVRYKQSREPASRRERDRERRQLDLPPLREGHIIVCSKTVWLGHLPKMVTESEIREELERMGTISDIKLVPPRGCAFVCFENRRHAARCVEKMRKDTKILGNLIKLCWAVNIGVKDKFDKWDSKYGCTYVPIDEKLEQMSGAELIALSEGGVLDEDSMPPSILEKVKATRDEVAAACEAENSPVINQQQQPSTSSAASTGEAATPPPLTTAQTSHTGEAFQSVAACSTAAQMFQTHQSPFTFVNTSPSSASVLTTDGSSFNLDVGFRNSPVSTADSQAGLSRQWAMNNANGAQFAGFQRVVIQHGPSFPTWSRPPVASTAYFGSAVPANIAVGIPQPETVRQAYAIDQSRATFNQQEGNASQKDVCGRQAEAVPPTGPTRSDQLVRPEGDMHSLGSPARDSPYSDSRISHPDMKNEEGDPLNANMVARTSPCKSTGQVTCPEPELWRRCNLPEKTALLQAPPTEGEKTPLLSINKQAAISNIPVEPPPSDSNVETLVDAKKPLSEPRLNAAGQYDQVPSHQACLLQTNAYMPDVTMPPPAIMQQQQQYVDRFGTPVRAPYRGGRMRPSPPTPFPFYRPNATPTRRGWNASPGPQFYGSRRERCPQNAFPVYNEANVESTGFAQDGRRGFRGGRYNTRYRWPNPQRFPHVGFQQHASHGPRGRGEGRGHHAYSREEHYTGGDIRKPFERSNRPSILGDPPLLAALPEHGGSRCFMNAGEGQEGGEPVAQSARPEDLAQEQCHASPIDGQSCAAPPKNDRSVENAGSP